MGKTGFDHQYGLYNWGVDYYTHAFPRLGGLDWHRNGRAVREEGYSTDLIAREAVRLIEQHNPAQPLFLYVAFNAPHAPLQAPEKYLDRYRHIRDEKRRAFAAMVTCMDAAVGQVLAALDKREMTNHTLIIFSSDNGGDIRYGADNGALRGGKFMLYEGGMRVPAWVVWPGKLRPGIVDQPLHMVDWYPTLLKLAGASLEQRLPLDGKDAWPTIAEGKPSPHEEILLNLEADGRAIRRGDWKLVIDGQRAVVNDKVVIDRRVELFNLAQDPYERTNLAKQYPAEVQALFARLDFYARQAVPAKGSLTLEGPPAGFKAPAVWGEKE